MAGAAACSAIMSCGEGVAWERIRRLASPSAPTQAQEDSRQDSAGQLFSARDRYETGLLVTDLDHSHRNSAHAGATTAALALRARISHAAGAGSRAVSIH